MAMKRATAAFLAVSLVLGTYPMPRVARADEIIEEEGQADTSAALENADAEAPEQSKDGDGTSEDVVASSEAAVVDATESPDDAQAELSAQSEEGSALEGTVASPELTVFQQSDANLPSKFDLRDRGVVTPVKRQEPWGNCWAYAAIAAAETSILTAMDSTYAETGLDLSERHLAWYVASPVTEAISKSQVGEGLYVYDIDAGANHVFDFGGREQCAATLFAQGIGPMPESDYPNRGANGTLAYDYLVANKETYIQERIAYYKGTYSWLSDDELRPFAEDDYDDAVEKYRKHDAYTPFDDWSITEPDEPGSGKLRGSAYTLTDNNVFSYWARLNGGELDAAEHFHKQPLYVNIDNAIWQDNIDQIKTELYEGRGVSLGLTISSSSLNTSTWSVYDNVHAYSPNHVVCIVGWDDDYPASNFKDTPPGNGAWIAKNSWGSETDAVMDGLIASDGTTKNANEYEWGIVDENGRHTGYFYLSYYDGTIGVPESFVFKIESNNDQQDALQHDYLPASVAEFFHVDENPMWEANIFTLEKDMRIDEVATRLRISNKAPLQNFTCTFDLYKLRDGATKPDDGTLVSTLTRTFQNQGYHRVALDAPVYLKKGDRLGIVVQHVHVAEDGVTLYGIEAQECDKYRTVHPNPVYGKSVVNEGESFFVIEGVTDEGSKSKDGWLDITAPLTKEMLLYLKPDVAANPSMLDFYVQRYCGKPIQSFFNIDNFGIKAFGEPATLEHVDAVAPTCEEAGSTEHWLDRSTGIAYADENGTESLKDTTVAALGHKWDSGTVTRKPTCTQEGTKTYTCENDKTHSKSEPIEALGHDWGAASYTWSKDHKTCTATRVCARDGSHKETEKAEVTSKVTTEPTDKKSGVRTYTATFGASWAKTQTKTETIPAKGTHADTKKPAKSSATKSASSGEHLARTGDEGTGPVAAFVLMGICMLLAGVSLQKMRYRSR